MPNIMCLEDNFWRELFEQSKASYHLTSSLHCFNAQSVLAV